MKLLRPLLGIAFVLGTPLICTGGKADGDAPAGGKAGEISDIQMVPALWNHGLNSTNLVGYRKGEHLIISDMWTGALGNDAVIRHSLRVKVSAWNKPFTADWESDDKRQKETLTVTLRAMKNEREMGAEFDHTVFEDGRVVLRFSGTTILARLN